MKCVDCKDYVGEICQKAQEGKISEIDDPICLMRCQISLLRSIWEELCDLNANWDEGDNWKQNGS